MTPSVTLGQRPTPSNRREKLGCCLMRCCGQFHIANARTYCRELGGCVVIEVPSKTPSRTVSVAPLFFIMLPSRNHPAFPFLSTILGPTAHPRPSGCDPFTSSLQLHHLRPILPLNPPTANSSLNAQPKRYASQMPPHFHSAYKNSQRQTESNMHNV